MEDLGSKPLRGAVCAWHCPQLFYLLYIKETKFSTNYCLILDTDILILPYD